MSETKKATPSQISFGGAVVTIVALVIVLSLGFAVFNLDAKVIFLIASIVIGICLVCYKFKVQQIIEWYTEGCKGAIDVILILMSVGTVIGSWMISGVVPTIMYYGISFLTPTSFMLIGFILCCVVSFFVGSSYSTLATLGVAFMGIGAGLGMNPGLVGGMVVSGALFGDKMSPFSDTTNMAPAVSGTTIYKHINSMLYTTVPALVIAFILYAIFSMNIDTANAEMSAVSEMLDALSGTFTISPLLLIVPVFVLVLAVLKVHPVVAMLSSACLATVLGFFVQAGNFDALTILSALGNGVSVDTGNAMVNRLVCRGGIASMMEVVAWTLLTLGMGQTLKQSGVLDAFLKKLLMIIKTKRGLVLGTLVCSLVTSMLTAAQYLAIMLPGTLLKDAYTEYKLDKRVLSRTLEDGGTMFSFLVPWDTAGIYTASVLGISTLTYAPYAFLLIACPIIAAIYALVGFAQFPAKDE